MQRLALFSQSLRRLNRRERDILMMRYVFDCSFADIAKKHWRAAQTVLFLRGVCKGESSASLSRELHMAYDTVHHLRQRLQANARRLQAKTTLPDATTETDEMFQNAGEKR